MARLRFNFIGGMITDNPLTSGATAMNSDAFAALPTIASPDYAAITIDPDGTEGAPEIAWITAHTAAATSATVSRGQEGTTALQHSQDVYWAHGPTLQDYDGPGGGTGLIGMTMYNPGTVADISTTSSAYSSVDAANLKVTFTVPASGKVLCKLTARAYCAGADWIHWGVHDGTSDIAVSDAQVGQSGNGRFVHEFLVTGLTPMAAATWTWRHKNESNSVAVHTIYGGASGMALMEILAVNL